MFIFLGMPVDSRIVHFLCLIFIYFELGLFGSYLLIYDSGEISSISIKFSDGVSVYLFNSGDYFQSYFKDFFYLTEQALGSLLVATEFKYLW